jgi:hypothetical protein
MKDLYVLSMGQECPTVSVLKLRTMFKAYVVMNQLKPESMKKSSLILVFFCEAIGTAATPRLLCQPRVRVKMIVEKQMDGRLCRGNKPKISEKTYPSDTFVHHKIPHGQTRD